MQRHYKKSLFALFLSAAVFLGPAPLDALAQAPARGELMIDRSFDFVKDDAFIVDVGDADLVVNTGAQQTATVRVYLAGRNMDRAREYFERQHFTVTRDDQGVVVRTRRERSQNWSWGRNGSPRITVVADIPTWSSVDLVTSDGDITLADLEGTVTVRTSDGDVAFSALRSSNVSLTTSDGDIEGDVIVAGVVRIRTSDGDLRLRQVEAETVEALTSDGDIVVESSIGDALFRTSDGDIRIGHIEGHEVSTRTADGDISLERIVAGKATIHTSDGSVSISSAEGNIDAKTSDGDIRVGVTKPGAMDLRTSDGSVTLRVADGLPANLELSGRTVRLASSLDFNGDHVRRSASGTLNGGGALIRARASDGTVSVQSAGGR